MAESQVDENTEENETVDSGTAIAGLTPEQVASALKAARAEAAERRVAQKSLKEERDELQEKLDKIERSQMSEVDKQKAENEDLRKENKSLKLEMLRHDVAEEILDDPALADVLKGESKEEIVASANLLKSKLSPQGERATASSMFAGVRGGPVGDEAAKSESQWFRDELSK